MTKSSLPESTILRTISGVGCQVVTMIGRKRVVADAVVAYGRDQFTGIAVG